MKGSYHISTVFQMLYSILQINYLTEAQSSQIMKFCATNLEH